MKQRETKIEEEHWRKERRLEEEETLEDSGKKERKFEEEGKDFGE